MTEAGLNRWREKVKKEQQKYCLLLGNRIYDEFCPENPQYIQTKVGYAIYGLPQCLPKDFDQNRPDQCSLGAFLWSKEQRSFINELTDFVIESATRTKSNPGDPFKLAFIFVSGYMSENDTYSVPVIRIHGHSETGFVDTSCRYYKDWNDYLENNILPPSNYVYPQDGIYCTDASYKVLISEGKTPAALTTRMVLNTVDQVSGWLGLGSAVAAIGGTLLCPPVALGAVVVGASTGIWAGARSVLGLVDKQTHGQSISLLDSAARGNWLTIAGGVVGVASSGAMAYMRFAASTGRSLGLAAKGVALGFQGANITVNGISVADAAYRVITKNGPPEPLELLQMGVAVFFFSHAVVSFQTPGNLIAEVQESTRENLLSVSSKRQGKILRKNWNRALRSDNPELAKAGVIKRVNIKLGSNNCLSKIAGMKSPQIAVMNTGQSDSLTQLKRTFKVSNLRDIDVNGKQPLIAARPYQMLILGSAIKSIDVLVSNILTLKKLFVILKKIILKYNPGNPNSFINIFQSVITFISYFSLNEASELPMEERVKLAVEKSFPEFLELLDELMRCYETATECVAGFLKERGEVNERALERASNVGRRPVEGAESMEEQEKSLLEVCLEAGARFLGLPSLSLEDMEDYRIVERLTYFTFNRVMSDSLDLKGFTVLFTEGGQIENLTLEDLPSKCVAGFLRERGEVNEWAFESASNVGRRPFEGAESMEEQEKIFLEVCLEAGARFFGFPSLSLEDMEDYRIEERHTYFTFNHVMSDRLDLKGFTVLFTEGGQIESLTLEYLPSAPSSEPAERICC